MITDDYIDTSIEFVSDNGIHESNYMNNTEILVQNLPELRIVDVLETCDELEARDETRDDTCDDCSEKTVELALESNLE